MSPAQLAQRTAAARKGGQARAKQFTSQSQSAARSNVKTESLRAAGRAGYDAGVRKHGPHFYGERLAMWRRKHPTNLERIIITWLDEWKETYRRDVYIAGYYVDFLLLFDIVVECDGAHWHTNNNHHGEDRETLDMHRARKIVKAGYNIIRLSEANIINGSAKKYLRDRLDVLTIIRM